MNATNADKDERTQPTESDLSLKHPSWLEIDLSRLDANVAAWRKLLARPVDHHRNARPARLCAVVKADAYGLGAVPIARRLDAAGIDMLAVYSPQQARELLEAGVTTPILALMPVRRLDPGDLLGQAVQRGQVELAASDVQELVQLEEAGRALGAALPVHLYLDTGMCRGGLVEEDLPEVAVRCRASRALRLAGVWTHFAAPADDPAFTFQQMDRFEQMVQGGFPTLSDDVCLHASGTFAALRDQSLHLDMVRIGLGLYGYGPDMMHREPAVNPMPFLQPVLRWNSRIIQMQRYKAGETVGYDRTARLPRDSILGLVPVGYADGYPLSLSNKPTVAVTHTAGQPPFHAPVIGKVNMDQIVIDLTDAPPQTRKNPTDITVELISNDPNSPCALPRLATLANSSCYELLCRLSTRLPRVYVCPEARPMGMSLRRTISQVSAKR